MGNSLVPMASKRCTESGLLASDSKTTSDKENANEMSEEEVEPHRWNEFSYITCHD